MAIRTLIEEFLQSALKELEFSIATISLEHPADISHGDYATNVALLLAKEQGDNPQELAKKIVEKLSRNIPENIEKIEVAGPGFINFYLSRDFFAESISSALAQKETWGTNTGLIGKKVMVEYTDPNPFKEFHIGHLVPNVIGESLSRLFEFSGAEVKRASYQGDIGLHVAQALWGALQADVPKTVAEWGIAYARGAKAYAEEASAKQEIIEINKKVYARSDEKLMRLYESGKKLSLESFEEMYRKLGTVFDFYFFESEVASLGKDLVLKHLGSVFEKSEGAVIFKGEKHGLHTRVFLNAEGLPTYEAKELGLALKKQELWPHDLSFTVTASEQNEYFKVLIAALSEIDEGVSKKIRHIGNGMLQLSSGKMSSRTGNVVTAAWLLLELIKSVKEKMSERRGGDDEEIILAIAVSAAKYSILRQAVGGNIIFDVQKSLSFEGDSGPYLQYAAIRARSVLAKAESEGNTKNFPKETTMLERLLYRFPEVVKRAAGSHEPHLLTTFLIELAGAFNSWYAEEKILDTKDSSYKLAITKAFYQTIVNGLWLLGIKLPERM